MKIVDSKYLITTQLLHYVNCCIIQLWLKLVKFVHSVFLLLILNPKFKQSHFCSDVQKTIDLNHDNNVYKNISEQL